MGDRYRDYLKTQKKGPIAPQLGAPRSRRSSEAADQRSKAIKRQQSRSKILYGTSPWIQGRLELDA